MGGHEWESWSWEGIPVVAGADLTAHSVVICAGMSSPDQRQISTDKAIIYIKFEAGLHESVDIVLDWRSIYTCAHWVNLYMYALQSLKEAHCAFYTCKHHGGKLRIPRPRTVLCVRNLKKSRPCRFGAHPLVRRILSSNTNPQFKKKICDHCTCDDQAYNLNYGSLTNTWEFGHGISLEQMRK